MSLPDKIPDRGPRELARMRRRIALIGLAAGLVLGAIGYAGAVAAFPLTCADGWRSESIGEAGACSQHGGIDPTLGVRRLAAGAGLGLVAGLGTWLVLRRRQQKLLAQEAEIAAAMRAQYRS